MKYLIVVLLSVLAVSTHAQKVTGYWYGQANVQTSGIQNNYLTELIISQKGNKVRGFFGYYFKDVYQSFVVKGTYDPKTRSVVINDIPIIYYQTNSTMNSVDCITSFHGTLRVSKVKSELSGYFYRDKKYTYTCPDLRVNYTLYTEAKVEDSIFKDLSATRSFWKPQPPAPDVVRSNNANRETEMAMPENKPATTPPVAKVTASGKTVTSKSPAAPAAAKAAPAKTVATPSVAVAEKTTAPNIASGKSAEPITAEQAAVPLDILRIKEDFKKRNNIVSKQISVSSDSIRLSFYDNGEIDGDSISVFLNGKIVVAHQRLAERAFNLYLQLDSTLQINEVSMFAENLGKYPPNTALMVISDGDQRYETFLSSDFKGNATIRLKTVRNQATAGK